MLTLKQIRDNKEFAIERLSIKGVDAVAAIERIETLDDKRKAIQAEADTLLAEQNSIAKSIGGLYAQGKRDEADALKTRTAELKEQSKALDEELKTVVEALNAEIVLLPNFPAAIVPKGNSAKDNIILKETDNIPDRKSVV